MTLRSACDDQSGGRRPAQIPQLDTPQASNESHISMHNPREREVGKVQFERRFGRQD